MVLVTILVFVPANGGGATSAMFQRAASAACGGTINHLFEIKHQACPRNQSSKNAPFRLTQFIPLGSQDRGNAEVVRIRNIRTLCRRNSLLMNNTAGGLQQAEAKQVGCDQSRGRDIGKQKLVAPRHRLPPPSRSPDTPGQRRREPGPNLFGRSGVWSSHSLSASSSGIP